MNCLQQVRNISIEGTKSFLSYSYNKILQLSHIVNKFNHKLISTVRKTLNGVSDRIEAFNKY